MKTILIISLYIFIGVSALLVIFLVSASSPFVYNNNYIVFTDENMKLQEDKKIETYDVIVPKKYTLERKEYNLTFNLEYHRLDSTVYIVLTTKENKKLKFKENDFVSEPNPLLDVYLNYKTAEGLPEYIYNITSNQKYGIGRVINSLFKTKNTIMKSEYAKMKNKAHYISFDIVNEKGELIKREKLSFDLFILENTFGAYLDLF